MQYDDLIKKLVEFEPACENPEKITNAVLQKIDASKPADNGLFLRTNKRQWIVFKGVRNAVAAAVVFLIVFLFYEQWQVNRKIQQLEERITPTEIRYSSIQFGDFSLNDDLPKVDMSFAGDSASSVLQINRRSLNYLLMKISELEKENLSFREKLQLHYNDSVRFNNKITKQ